MGRRKYSETHIAGRRRRRETRQVIYMVLGFVVMIGTIILGFVMYHAAKKKETTPIIREAPKDSGKKSG
jgi:preprotein translocase subunit SecY